MPMTVAEFHKWMGEAEPKEQPRVRCRIVMDVEIVPVEDDLTPNDSLAIQESPIEDYCRDLARDFENGRLELLSVRDEPLPALPSDDNVLDEMCPECGYFCCECLDEVES